MDIIFFKQSVQDVLVPCLAERFNKSTPSSNPIGLTEEQNQSDS